MATDRVAKPGAKTYQVLPIHSAPVHPTERSGAHSETSLDHRARLRRTQARTRTWSLRRTRLARFSPSRYPLHRGLWVLGGRTEPFFPLRSRRSSGLTPLQNAAQVPPQGLARYAWRGIIPGRLPPSVKPSPEFYSGNFRVVLFAELPFYNTVVLAGCGKTPSLNESPIRSSSWFRVPSSFRRI